VSGPYGIREVSISIPTVVGRKGVEGQLEIELWPKETSALQHSAQVLRETIEAVYKSNPKAAGNAGAPRVPQTAKADVSPALTRAVRVTMGAGGGGNGSHGSSRVTVSGQSQGKR
jgi:L-lactate dehydrogenase